MHQTLLVDRQTTVENDFLDPILKRWRDAPRALFGAFYTGGCWTEVTFSEFMERAIRYTGLLQAHGIEPGDIVCIVLRHDLDAHAAFLGAMLAGAVPAFLPYPNVKTDHRLYWYQHELVFNHVRPGAVIVYDELAGAVEACLGDVRSKVICQSEAQRALPADQFRFGPDLATGLLQHSSGTTGLKKGVALSYRSVTGLIQAYRSALGIDDTRGLAVATWLPLYHDLGLITGFLMPLRLGLPIITVDPFDWVAKPELLFTAIERYRATHVWMPNFAFQHLARRLSKDVSYDLSSMAVFVDAAEPCKPKTFDEFLRRFGAFGLREECLQTAYGMAETVLVVTQNSLSRPPRRLALERASLESFGPVRKASGAGEQMVLLSNGAPLPGCEIAIWRGEEPVGEWEIGEVVVSVDYMFSGYYKNAEATKAALCGRWYRSGDIGFLADGELYICGRIKDLIIVNGKNVFAHDVEAALTGTAGLKPGRSVAFGHYSDRTGSEQLIVMAERDDRQRSATELLKEINHRVVEAVGVSCGDVRLVEQGWLIKTTSGKISRSENARKYAAEFYGADS